MVEVKEDPGQALFREGLFVRALGRPLSSNPYPPQSVEGRLWAEGWRMIDTRRDSAARYLSSTALKSVARRSAIGAPAARAREPTGRQKIVTWARVLRDYLSPCAALTCLIIVALLLIARFHS
jgi:hypothetical protein